MYSSGFYCHLSVESLLVCASGGWRVCCSDAVLRPSSRFTASKRFNHCKTLIKKATCLAVPRSCVFLLLDDTNTVRNPHLFGLQVSCIVVDARVEFLPRRKWMEAAPHAGGCWRWCCCKVVEGVVWQCLAMGTMLRMRHDGCSSNQEQLQVATESSLEAE